MFSEKQIKEMISAGAQSEIAEALEGDISIGGDLEVTGSINGEENPSVKPIYFHGIEMSNSTDMTVLELHVLNNTETKINTPAKVVAWANSIEGEVRIPVNGCIKYNNVYYQAYLILKNSSNKYYIYYVSATGLSYTGFSDVDLTTIFTAGNDSVNKIN